MEMSSQLHAPAALPPRKEVRYPLDSRLTGSLVVEKIRFLRKITRLDSGCESHTSRYQSLKNARKTYCAFSSVLVMIMFVM
jgi:hypothetical protein